jgi:hypothetical protein
MHVHSLQAAKDTRHKMGPAADKITLIHFNDVYNVESREVEPVGGAARFVTAINDFAHLNPLVLFSGDIFAPSISECTSLSPETQAQKCRANFALTRSARAPFGLHSGCYYSNIALLFSEHLHEGRADDPRVEPHRRTLRLLRKSRLR